MVHNAITLISYYWNTVTTPSTFRPGSKEIFTATSSPTAAPADEHGKGFLLSCKCYGACPLL